jgi:hypothetical protein
VVDLAGSGPSRPSSSGRVGAWVGACPFGSAEPSSAATPPEVHGLHRRKLIADARNRLGVSLVLDRSCRCPGTRHRVPEPRTRPMTGAKQRRLTPPLPRCCAVQGTTTTAPKACGSWPSGRSAAASHPRPPSSGEGFGVRPSPRWLARRRDGVGGRPRGQIRGSPHGQGSAQPQFFSVRHGRRAHRHGRPSHWRRARGQTPSSTLRLACRWRPNPTRSAC